MQENQDFTMQEIHDKTSFVADYSGFWCRFTNLTDEYRKHDLSFLDMANFINFVISWIKVNLCAKYNIFVSMLEFHEKN